MRAPFNFLNGSGSFALLANELGRLTGQSAPSSSTPIAAGAAVPVVTTATAPASVSVAAAANTTTVERSFERPELIVTWALLPGGKATTEIDDHGYRGMRSGS